MSPTRDRGTGSVLIKTMSLYQFPRWTDAIRPLLGVTALGESISAAQTRAYEAVDIVDWPDGFCRRDIGWRAIERVD